MGSVIEKFRSIPKAKVVIPAAFVAVALGAFTGYYLSLPQDAHIKSTHVIEQGDMSDAETQAMLDEIAESSRITVTVQPEVQMDADGRLKLDFEVPEGNNGISERVEIEQGGKVLYTSAPLAPGEGIEWTDPVDGARKGQALERVVAVDERGEPMGNPVSFDVVIVK